MCSKHLKLACERKLPNLLLILVFFTISTLFYFYPCMWLLHNLSMAVPIIQTIFLISCCLNYLICIFIDPGILCRDPDDPNSVLEAEEVTVNGTTFTKKWCQICRFFRPPRCRHCYTCNVCVENLDHHCTLMNTCIGKRNYRFFFILLLSLMFFTLLTLGFCLTYVFLNTREHYTIEKIFTFILLCLTGVISFPVVYFFGFHCCLVSTGKTTYEQYIGVYKSKMSPFNRGCLKNFSLMLLSPLSTSRVKSTTKTQKINHLQEQIPLSVVVTSRTTGCALLINNTATSHSSALDIPTPPWSVITLASPHRVASLTSSSRITDLPNSSCSVPAPTDPLSVIPLKASSPETDPSYSWPVTALPAIPPGNALTTHSATSSLTNRTVLIAMTEPLTVTTLPVPSVVITLSSPPPVTAHTLPSEIVPRTCPNLSVPSLARTVQSCSIAVTGPT
ncbi:palmitoyltransferase ZDHHC5-B-like [Scyliorhinus canicula]|uniref:palmitoyltransferase ZDHHC5-B-like n=1 Tax=Scyliorhinus canicula TaxID=7830 RepID=UPI0018F5A65E|nr:palmitoyltransferase ZDHHC5-B-like [Scyliorhinus canicula]